MSELEIAATELHSSDSAGHNIINWGEQAS